MFLACSSAAKLIPTNVPTPTLTKTPKPTPTITPTPFYKVEPGRRISIPSGGFSFSQPLGYDVLENDSTSAYLLNSDGMVNIVVFSHPRPRGLSIDGVVKYMFEDMDTWYDDFNHGDPVRTDLDEVTSISTEFTGTDETGPLRGNLTVYQPGKSKLVYVVITTRGDQRWEREGQKLLDLTKDNLEFFRIKSLQDCPTTKNPDYGTTRTKPIMIGGGESDGMNRIIRYLEALLGVNGEVISYWPGETTLADGVELEVFELQVGNLFRTLYFDTTKFEELHVPTSLTCSAPLPEEP